MLSQLLARILAGRISAGFPQYSAHLALGGSIDAFWLRAAVFSLQRQADAAHKTAKKLANVARRSLGIGRAAFALGAALSFVSYLLSGNRRMRQILFELRLRSASNDQPAHGVLDKLCFREYRVFSPSGVYFRFQQISELFFGGQSAFAATPVESANHKVMSMLVQARSDARFSPEGAYA